MKQLILDKFGIGLTKEEASPSFDLRRSIPVRLLLLRLEQLSSLRFSANAARDLINSSLPFSFQDSDIERVEAYAKTLHLVSYSEGNICYLKVCVLYS